MDTDARRLELQKLGALGFFQVEVVKELSVKRACSERTLYNYFETCSSWQPVLQSVVKADEVLLKVINRRSVRSSLCTPKLSLKNIHQKK